MSYLAGMTRAWASVLFFAFMIVASQSGCSSSSSEPASNGLEPGDALDYQLFPTTTVLDGTSLGALATSARDGTLTFRGAPAQVAALKPGAIVLAGVGSPAAPQGFARYVGDVQTSPDGVVLKTIPVPLQLAFQKLHLKATRRVDDLGGRRFAKADLTPKDFTGGAGSPPQTVDFYAFNGDQDPSTTNDQVHVRGELGGGVYYTLGIDADWGQVLAVPDAALKCLASLFGAAVGLGPASCSITDLIPEITVSFTAGADAAAKLAIDGVAFNAYSKDYYLGAIAIEPTSTFMIGPVPVTVDLSVAGRIKGEASSNFALSAGGSFHAGTGLTVSSKKAPTFDPPHVDPPSFEPPTADATLAASGYVGVGPKLALKVFDFAGPYIALLGYAKITADQKNDPCFTVEGGVSFSGGIDIGIDFAALGFSWLGKIDILDVPLPGFDKGFPIASGSCKPPPAGASTLPPGSGPDATHLLTPSYTPWSRTYEGPIAHYPHMSGGFQWMDVTRSIDGHYVVSGSGMNALVKIRDDGEPIWAKRYHDDAAPAADPADLVVGRVAKTSDASLFVTAYPYTIMKIGQGGGLYWAEHFPDVARGEDGGPHGSRTEENTFTGALEDGSGGLYVIGTHQVPQSSPVVTEGWMMRLGPDGEVLWSKALRLPGSRLYPLTITPSDGGFVVSGWEWTGVFTPEGRRMFIARVNADGSLAWAERVVGCGTDTNLLEVQPTAAIRTAGGNTLLAGRLGAYERSFVLVVKPDGSFASQSNPWSTSNLSYMTIHAIKELPTSGYVAAGSYVKDYDARALFLAGLDSGGALQWLKRYQLIGSGSEADFPGLALPDDGGMLATGYTTLPTSGQGSLWAMKPYAKDGSIAFGAGGAVDVVPSAMGSCPLVGSAISLEVASFAATPKPYALTTVDVPLAKTTQAP